MLSKYVYSGVIMCMLTAQSYICLILSPILFCGIYGPVSTFIIAACQPSPNLTLQRDAEVLKWSSVQSVQERMSK